MFYSRITASDRRTIERMWRDGATIKEISEVVGVTASALYRELKRGYDGTALGYGRSGYSAEIANEDAERRILSTKRTRTRSRMTSAGDCEASPHPPMPLKRGERGNGEGGTTRRKIRLLSNSEKVLSSYIMGRGKK